MAFQFKIQLKDVEDPVVWRRVIVPATFTLFRFHRVIQDAFGWEDSHLFQFSPGGWGSLPVYGLMVDTEDEETQNCKKVKLSQIFNKVGQTYTYIYDFGDNWVHLIELEKITGDQPNKAEVLAGEGKCPPEDCGGFWGYEELKTVLSAPSHPEYEGMKEWLGLSKRQKWDPAVFDLKKVQKAVERIK